MANPTGRGGFTKGRSGNPGGQPAWVKLVRDEAGKHAVAALRVLVRQLESKNEQVAAAAAREILDRAVGRPTQPIAGEEGGAPIGVVILPAVKPHVDG